MYSTCLYCNNALGSNEVIETFPVGRRLAFDQSKGRLWVVCRKCEKWNLSPLEERWEAIEQCERLFHDARKRVSTDNIGLAKLSEGLELVRIGEPQAPRICRVAIWRPVRATANARHPHRHRCRPRSAAASSSPAHRRNSLGGGWGMYQGVQGLIDLARKKRRLAIITAPDGRRLTIRGEHADKTRIDPGRLAADGGRSTCTTARMNASCSRENTRDARRP